MSYLPDGYRFRVQVEDDLQYQHDMHSQTDAPSSIPLPQAPWVPMEALMEVWVTFAAAADTPTLLHTVSEAFAALACEQSALDAYHHHVQQRANPPVPRASNPLLLSVMHALVTALGDLEQARAHWQQVSTLLDMAYQQYKDEQARDDLAHLFAFVLEQQTRLAVLLACLAAEQEDTTRRVMSRAAADKAQEGGQQP